MWRTQQMSIIRRLRLNNGDKIEIDYALEGEALTRTRVLFSKDYEYWYKHTYDFNDEEVSNVQLRSANIRVENILYKNVDCVKINNKNAIFLYPEVGTFATIEKVRN